MENQRIAAKIIVTERAALGKLQQGNLSAFLDIYADDITFFDPYQQQRLDGYEKVASYIESQGDNLSFVRFEMIDPAVKVAGHMAALSFNLHSWSEDDDAPTQWNCTEVYTLQPSGKWTIVHSHWSFTGE